MDIRNRYRRWRRYRNTLRELRDYSSHELGELGIARQDVERVAWAMRYGQA